MTKVIISEDCGNSPKNLLVRDLAIALAKGDMKFIRSKLTDDIRWNKVGTRSIQGKENVVEALEQMKSNDVAELTIQHIATHGKAGAVNGSIKFKDGTVRAFCDMYEFMDAKGTRIKEITSYVIEIK